MKRINLVLIIFALASILIMKNGASQDRSIELNNHPSLDTFDLNKYFLPELEYKTLNFNLNMNSNTSPITSKYDDNFRANTNLNLRNTVYINSHKIQKRLFTELYVRGDFSSYKKNSHKYYRRSMDTRFILNDDFRFYKKNKRFIGLDLNANINYRNSKYQNINSNQLNRALSSHASVGVSIGYGRVEDVTDTWRTIIMLKDFSRLNVLTRNPTEKDIIDIANTLAEIRNTRVFDYRKKKIFTLKAIDSKLNKLGIISNHDIDYFSSLEDSRSIYTDRRFAGSALSIGIQPHVFVYRNFEKDLSSSISYGGLFYFKHEFHKAINMFWQLDIDYFLNVDYQISNIENPDSKTRKNINIFPYFNLGVSYYPTTRTSFSSNLSLSYIDGSSVDSDKGLFNNGSFYAFWTNRIKYYISPRTSIRFDFAILYSNSDFRYGNLPIYYLNNSYGYMNRRYNAGLNYDTSLKFTYTIF